MSSVKLWPFHLSLNELNLPLHVIIYIHSYIRLKSNPHSAFHRLAPYQSNNSNGTYHGPTPQDEYHKWNFRIDIPSDICRINLIAPHSILWVKTTGRNRFHKFPTVYVHHRRDRDSGKHTYCYCRVPANQYVPLPRKHLIFISYIPERQNEVDNE